MGKVEGMYTRTQLNWLTDEIISSFVLNMPNGDHDDPRGEKHRKCCLCVLEDTGDEIKELIAKKG